MGDNFTFLLLLYVRPIAAASRILDQGRLVFAIIAAAIVCLLLHTPELGVMSNAMRPSPPVRHAVPEKAEPPDEGGPQVPAPGFAESAVLRWIGCSPMTLFTPLGAIVLALAPAALLMRTASGFGSFPVLMRSDYVSVLMCSLMAWTAAYLPLGIAIAVTGVGGPWLRMPALYLASSAYFLVLLAVSLRTAFGTGFAAALGTAAVAWVAAAVGTGLYGASGGMGYYVMSPFFLYFAYVMFVSDVRALGDGLRSRQNLKRQLEIATNNPRDADAHYQIGLIYHQRRQYTEALERFRRAVEIDKEEAESQLALGRVLREMDRIEEAIPPLEAAARLNDKVALSEVWRELGAAYFQAGRIDEAAAALAKYTERRPYDPEGLYWHGRTLAALGRTAEARQAFEQCVEAVETMPSHRRAHVRKWAGEARGQLKTIGRK
jgi:tetratricopeptide (TPR) repeat protein